MIGREKFYPRKENLGKACALWNPSRIELFGCNFPKAEMRRRTSCEGIIDDVCLFLKEGRPPQSLTKEQIAELKTRIPTSGPKPHIPPGNTD